MWYCNKCDRVWVSSLLRHGREPEYFTREDLAFYGFRDRECKLCTTANSEPPCDTVSPYGDMGCGPVSDHIEESIEESNRNISIEEKFKSLKTCMRPLR